MNKAEAAKALGVSVRRVEALDKDNRLGVKRYVRGKTGKQRDFDPEAVEALRFALESEDRALAAPNSPAALARVPGPEALAVAEQIAAGIEGQRADTARALQLLESIAGALADGRGPAVPLADKLTLSLAEAAELSGLSARHLREAIRAGELEGKIIGRGWRIKRADLDAYVRAL